MQAFHLGDDGAGTPQRIAELTSLNPSSSSSSSGAYGSENRSRNSGSKPSGPKIARLVVLPVSSSARAHVVAITKDARRVFLALDIKRRALRVVHSKPSDGITTAGARRGGAASGANVRQIAQGEELVCACGGSTLVAAARATSDGALSQLLAVLPNPAGATLCFAARGGRACWSCDWCSGVCCRPAGGHWLWDSGVVCMSVM